MKKTKTKAWVLPVYLGHKNGGILSCQLSVASCELSVDFCQLSVGFCQLLFWK